jgi:RNA polymerase sigma-70 factor (ECF subfamily)
LKAVAAGTSSLDHEQWAQHYQAHFHAVLHYVQRIVGSDWQSNSEDLAQEAFVVAYAKRHQFGGRSSLNTWICGIALNLVRQHMAREVFANRMTKIFSATDLIPQSSLSEDPLMVQVQRERAEEILSVVEGLPEKLFEAFVSCCILGVSQEESATQLGISEGNLRVRVARAKAMIRRRIQR